MQKLQSGPLLEMASKAEFWLDGGHNPAAGRALTEALSRLQSRKTILICGMLKTKDISGFLAPLHQVADHLIAVSIDVQAAVLQAQAIDPEARILICGSLYLAGQVLRDHA